MTTPRTPADRLAALLFAAMTDSPHPEVLADRLIDAGVRVEVPSVRESAARLGIPVTEHDIPPDIGGVPPFAADHEGVRVEDEGLRAAAEALLYEVGAYERAWLTSGTGFGDVRRACALVRAALAASPAPTTNVECPCGDVFPNAEAFHEHYLAVHVDPNDAFWSSAPMRPRPPQDIESLRMDVTDEEAEAFTAAIAEDNRSILERYHAGDLTEKQAADAIGVDRLSFRVILAREEPGDEMGG